MKHLLTAITTATIATFGIVETAEARGRGMGPMAGKAKAHFTPTASRSPKPTHGSGGNDRPPKPPIAAAAPASPKPPRKLTPIFNGAAKPPVGPLKPKFNKAARAPKQSRAGSSTPPAPANRLKGPLFKPPGI